MERRIESWYGSALVELLAVVLIAIPFGLGVGHASGQLLASLITSLAISSTIYISLKLDFRFIHPRFQKLPPDRQVVMETVAGLLEHIVGAWLAFFVCNRLFGSFLKGSLAWYMVVGTTVTSMVVHAISYTMYSHLDLKRRIIREEQLRAMATQAELKALKAQINPHFLFNTLNTIAALIHTDPSRAEATVERLAEMFRYVLAGSERGLVPLEEELSFVNGYLEIERVRFGERLRVTREIAPETLDVPVPSLILQPLVENAVRHGQGTDGGIDLTIRVQLQSDALEIAIADHGPGMPPREKVEENPGHGLRNVDERLRKTFGQGYGLEVAANEPQGAVVSVRIPV